LILSEIRILRRKSLLSSLHLPGKRIKKLKQLKKTGKFDKGSKMWVYSKKERQRRKVYQLNAGNGGSQRFEIYGQKEKTDYVNVLVND
jgi:hypothetical protein